MRRIRIGFYIVIYLMALFVTGITEIGCQKKSQQPAQFYCPMHPTYISTKPGECPICGMRLVSIEKKKETKQEVVYSCPMHPEVISDKPGKCSKCGMDLEEVSQSQLIPQDKTSSVLPSYHLKDEQNKSPQKIKFYRHPMNAEIISKEPAKDEMGMDYIPVYEDETHQPLSDRASFKLTSQRLHPSLIQTKIAEEGVLNKEINTIGTTIPDETRIRHIHTKISGWVEKLIVNYTGQMVNKDQPLLYIFSPELVRSQEEFLLAKKSESLTLSQGKKEDNLLNLSKKRLLLFDVPESFIENLEKTGKVSKSVPILSPISGFVFKKSVYEGQYIEQDIDLFAIVDLSKIWAEAIIYESEVHLVKLGQKARLSFSYLPEKNFEGKVDFIYPYLNPETRALQVRLVIDNYDYALKPGMFAKISIETEGKAGIVIPDSAIIDTGLRKIAYVENSVGEIVPREVKVDMISGGNALVSSGIDRGEKVVVKGNFLLDSESRIHAALYAHSHQNP